MTILDAAPGQTGVTTDPAQAFLQRLPAGYTGALCDLFHNAVRDGCSSPSEVLAWVVQDAGRRLVAPQIRTEQAEALHALLGALGIDPDGARAYAQSVIHWRSLPQEERNLRKEAQREVHRLLQMEALPPTPKQTAFLARLGHQGEAPPNRAEASRLIDALKNGGAPR